MRIAFFIYALTFSSLTTKAQKDGKEISRLLHSANEMSFSSFDQAIKLTDQAEQLINNKGHNQFAQELIRCYQIRILACRYFERLSLLRLYATKNAELVESMRTQLGSSYEKAKIDAKISWAQFYYEINDYAKSLTLFSESLAELKRLSQTQQVCEEESLIIEYIATIHNARGEFEAAINQFIASIPYAQCRAAGRKSDFPVLALLYRNIGRTYLNKGDLEKAKEYLTKAQQEFLPYLKKNPAAAASTAITLFEAQAFYYKQRHRFDSALIITEKAMPLVTYSEPFRDRVYHNLGKAYENLKRYPDAEKYYLQELSLLEKKTEQKTLQKTDAYLSLGNAYEKQGKTSQALNYYQRAIVNSIVDFKPAGLENPPLKNILSKRRLFTALQSKYRTQRKIDVNTSAQTCELALALLDSTANEYSLDRDKVVLQEQSIQAFEDGLNMSYELFNKTQDQKHFDNCFALIERSKGKVLLENLRMVNQFASVNPSLLESEREIKSELLLVEQSIFKGELAASPPDDLPAMRERYADLKHDYANLIQNIKHNAPDYYKLRFDHHVVDLQKIKTELLQPEEALIEFFVGDSTLITITVTSSKQHITQKKISTEFFEDLHGLRKLLSNPETDLKQLKAKSKEWYTLLFGDVLSKLDDQIRSLIIVPDGALGYIPFEVLIAPDNQYVIEKYSTRYAQSATYLNEQEHVHPKRSSSFFGGFISSEDDGNGTVNTTLVGAKKEIEFVAKMVGSEATIFNQATKQDFLQEASKFNVLHLAMHSMVNEKNPMLSVMAFSGSHDSINSQLTAIEIYNQHLNADLAVLSACNTGFGELHRGEGIMSFARAFSYAGVSSAAISLWEVPDKATSKIMINFYNYLKAGKTKAEALQLAKVEFINSYAAMAHPFYWSGFILSGSNKPVQFPVSHYWYWIPAGAVLLLFFLLIRRRFTTKKA